MFDAIETYNVDEKHNQKLIDFFLLPYRNESVILMQVLISIQHAASRNVIFVYVRTKAMAMYTFDS